MTVTKEQLVKEAVNTMLALACNSSYELLCTVQAIKDLLTRLGIGEDDLIAELFGRQEDGGENGVV